MDKRTVNSSLQIYWVKLTISGVIAPIRRMIQTDWLNLSNTFFFFFLVDLAEAQIG